ncbi:hypothetical protein MLD38_009065 [Melastoma candidum]|uniref:Uncharacterized protein n=1 Tax=Melastoma candidum TaxID=119954 RepID=A0ACB9RXS0_9MYRT|nr:hypothetical protein MLD38_009065 [Melastoma candidum]
MGRRKSKGLRATPGETARSQSAASHEQEAVEGDRLSSLLESIQSKTKEARSSDGDKALPEKIWFKRQFAVGVNEVTRTLERMPPDPPPSEGGNTHQRLQAVLLASDCDPRWLIRHLPGLARSRKVPLIYVRDKKHGSSRLGQIANVRTAIAVGIKARGNALNRCLEEILHSRMDKLDADDLI